MPKKSNEIDKYYDEFVEQNVQDKKKLNKQLLVNLHKIPKKDKGANLPHIKATEKNAYHQADILFLPNDDGYKYALVVVDVYSRHCDARPLKTKDSEEVLNAFISIYNGEYLEKPYKLGVDPGTEFKGKVKKYMEEHKIWLKVGKPGRHRQQALVEYKNKLIAQVLFKRMTAQELLTGVQSNEWVEDLPKVIRVINKLSKPQPPIDYDKLPRCSGDSCELLNEGTKVRVMLEEPRAATERGEKLIGKFRATDIRWNPEKHIVTDILLKPDSPPLYVLDNDNSTVYTKNQLQVIPKKEQRPPIKVVRGNPEVWKIRKILGKKRKNGRVKYKIKWETGDITWEPRKNLIDDIPDMIKEYEKKLKSLKKK